MLIVKKFGGTSVGNKERIFNVAGRCAEEYRKGNDVVVVLSAMGKYTDELIAMAEDINEKPPKKRNGYAFHYRGADVGGADEHGPGQNGDPGGVSERIPGGDAYHQRSRKRAA